MVDLVDRIYRYQCTLWFYYLHKQCSCSHIRQTLCRRYRILCNEESDLIKQPKAERIGHVNNIPTMQFFTGVSKNTQSKSYIYIIIDLVSREFRNNALWILIDMPKSWLSKLPCMRCNCYSTHRLTV